MVLHGFLPMTRAPILVIHQVSARGRNKAENAALPDDAQLGSQRSAIKAELHHSWSLDSPASQVLAGFGLDFQVCCTARAKYAKLAFQPPPHRRFAKRSRSRGCASSKIKCRELAISSSHSYLEAK